MGLPYRFGIATETTFERFNGGGGPATTSIEARYAFADWNKIPLNPTIFVEYKFGIGPIRHEEGPPPPPGEGEEESGPPKVQTHMSCGSSWRMNLSAGSNGPQRLLRKGKYGRPWP